MLPRISTVECQDVNFLLFATNDVISNALFRTGKWEGHLIQLSKFYLSKIETPLILDIGANLGAYSVPLAKHVQNTGGKVIGFEPQRIVFYQLCANVILNRLDNYHPIYSAVGEVVGEVDIPEIDYEKNVNIGAFSFSKQYRELHGIEGSMKKSSTKVPVINLDSYEFEKPPALIKIDVEGFELAVLKGAVNFLKNSNFPLMLFEAWDFDWFKKDREELLAFVKNLGYEITKLSPTEYAAQHPNNPVHVEFISNSDGTIKMSVK